MDAVIKIERSGCGDEGYFKFGIIQYKKIRNDHQNIYFVCGDHGTGDSDQCC